MPRSRHPAPLLALGLCACLSFGGRRPHVTCATTSSDTTGWVRLQAGRDFSFLLPPGFRENKVEPIDSYVRGFESGNATLTLDYGHYSADVRESVGAGTSRLECPEQIGGHDAVIVASWSDRVAYNVGASWRDVRPGVHLWIGGAATTAAGQHDLLTVLRSVRFNPP